MNDNKRIFKNSIILYARLFITTIIGILSVRIVLKCLGTSDFGLYSVVGGIVVMINILNTSMNSASQRFISFEMGKGDTISVNKVFNISFILHAGLGCFLILLAETLGTYYIHHYLNIPADRVDDAMFVFRFSVMAAFFSVLSVPFQSLITALEKFSVRASIEIISAFLKIGFVVLLLFYMGNRLKMYSVMMAFVIAVISVLYIMYCHWKYKSYVSWNFQKDKRKYLEMTGFSGWILVGAVACIGRVQGAALIINLFFGTILNAAFGVANQVNNLILLFSQTLGQTAIPQITKSYSIGNSDRTTQLVCYMSKYTTFLMLLPAVPILLETKFLLNLWLDEVPEYTVIFCQLMLVNALIDSLGAATSAAVQATGKIKPFQISISVISLMSLPAAFILFKVGFPPYTIITAYIVTSAVNVIARQILLKRLINFDVKRFITVSYLRVFYVIAFVSPLFFIKHLFHEGIARFSCLSVLSIIWVCAAIYAVGTKRNERSVLFSTIFKRFR